MSGVGAAPERSGAPAATPTWAVSPERTRRVRARPGARAATPVTLGAAVVLVVAVAVAEIVHVVGRDDLVPALRGFLVVVVTAQIGLAWGALRRSPGAALGLFLCEATAAVAAATGGLADGPGRIVLAAGAIGALVLLGLSLRAFPSPELP